MWFPKQLYSNFYRIKKKLGTKTSIDDIKCSFLKKFEFNSTVCIDFCLKNFCRLTTK